MPGAHGIAEPWNIAAVVADSPMTLAYAGFQTYINKKDKAFGADSIQLAQKVLQLMAENKLPNSYLPFADQNEATASMYYVIGNFSVDTNLSGAAVNFYKALQFNSKIKNNSYPYFIIAYNYEKEFAKAAKEYDDKYRSSPASAAAQTAEAHLEKLMNNMQDAYARAIKLGEAENAPKVGEWKKRFMQIYGFIKGDDNIKADDQGAAQYLASVLTTPMPDPSAP